MSTPIDQGIPDESINWTEIHAFMVSLDKQEKNDTIKRGACEKIIYDIMTRTEKSTSLSTSNIASPFDDGPCVKSSSSPVDMMTTISATTTDRPRRHDDGASNQEQPTSHRRNKQELAPIVYCPLRRTMSFRESSRPESSFVRTRSTGNFRESARPKSSCLSTIRRRSTDGELRVSWTNMHSVLRFDADESPTTNTARRNVETTTEPLIFPPLPFADEHCDDIRGTRGRRGSGSSISPGGAHLTSASRSSSLGRIPTSPREPLILPGYSLGQSPENRQHMNIPTTRDAGAEYASTLRPLDVAFVLRSDGNWVYGIVCDITGPNGRSDDKVGPPCHQPSIRFAVDSHGSTKTIQKKNWGRKIRLINEDHAKRVCATTVA